MVAAALVAGAAVLAVAEGCQKEDPFRPPEDSIEGKWGGNGVRFAVDTDFATLAFNCGTGVINSAVVVDKQGQFQTEGTYMQAQRMFRAIYKGTAGGTSMTLNVILPDEQMELGPYQLQYGELGRIGPCGAP